MTENNPQSPQSSAEKVAVPDPAQAKIPKKDDKGIDSLFDIFTNEEVVDSPISKLSKELGDVSIYSLLEQTKQIAEGMRCGH